MAEAIIWGTVAIGLLIAIPYFALFIGVNITGYSKRQSPPRRRR